MLDFGRDASVLKMCKRWMIAGLRVIPAWLTISLIVVCLHLSVLTSGAFMLRLLGWIFTSLLVFVITAASLGNRRQRCKPAARLQMRNSGETSKPVESAPAMPNLASRPPREKIARHARIRRVKTASCRHFRKTVRASRFNSIRFR